MGKTWIQLNSAGAAGPPGAPGASGVGTPAPNITSATCAVSFQAWANVQQIVFSGTITLPTGDPQYAHLKAIEVYAIDPSGNAQLVSRFDSWSGSTISYSGVAGLQPS